MGLDGDAHSVHRGSKRVSQDRSIASPQGMAVRRREFSLTSFPGQWAPAGIQISGRVERSGDVFSYWIELSGGRPAAGPGISTPSLHRAAPGGEAGMPSALDCLDIPAPAATPGRRDSLWESTCFEFFLAPADSLCYWEFNLSPSGDWNVYRFDSYRQGMRAENAFSDFPFRVQRDPDVLAISGRLALDCMLGALAADAGGHTPSDGRSDVQNLDVGVSTVLKDRNGQVSYWALTHCLERPDFHARESFVIRLAG